MYSHEFHEMFADQACLVEDEMSWITIGLHYNRSKSLRVKSSMKCCRMKSYLLPLLKAGASSQQHIQVQSPVSEMERGSSEPPVPRNIDPSTSTGPMSIPRSSSVSCHPQPGSKKHKRTPLYQRSVRGHVQWCPCWLNRPMTWCGVVWFVF